jgi:hypothetical protein
MHLESKCCHSFLNPHIPEFSRTLKIERISNPKENNFKKENFVAVQGFINWYHRLMLFCNPSSFQNPLCKTLAL